MNEEPTTTTPAALTPEQERWVAALESGDYVQGTAYLCRANKFCCLGVAMELFHEGAKTSYGMARRGYITAAGADYVTELSPEVSAKLGIIDGPEGPVINRLIGFNDSGSHTFKQIAQYIRDNAAKVFTQPDAPAAHPVQLPMGTKPDAG